MPVVLSGWATFVGLKILFLSPFLLIYHTTLLSVSMYTYGSNIRGSQPNIFIFNQRMLSIFIMSFNGKILPSMKSNLTVMLTSIMFAVIYVI